MPAYIVFIRRRITDAGEMEIYKSKVGKAAEGHSLKPLVRYGAFDVLEGTSAEGAVVLEFADMDAARRWYGSEAYQEASRHRRLGSDYDVILLEGVAMEQAG